MSCKRHDNKIYEKTSNLFLEFLSSISTIHFLFGFFPILISVSNCQHAFIFWSYSPIFQHKLGFDVKYFSYPDMDLQSNCSVLSLYSIIWTLPSSYVHICFFLFLNRLLFGVFTFGSVFSVFTLVLAYGFFCFWCCGFSTHKICISAYWLPLNLRL